MCENLLEFEENYQPTHVVAAITYGGDAHIVFTKLIDHHKANEIISGSLYANYEKTNEKPFEANGHLKVNYTDDKLDVSDSLTIKVT